MELQLSTRRSAYIIIAFIVLEFIIIQVFGLGALALYDLLAKALFVIGGVLSIPCFFLFIGSRDMRDRVIDDVDEKGEEKVEFEPNITHPDLYETGKLLLPYAILLAIVGVLAMCLVYAFQNFGI